jgi:hypothetical protein
LEAQILLLVPFISACSYLVGLVLHYRSRRDDRNLIEHIVDEALKKVDGPVSMSQATEIVAEAIKLADDSRRPSPRSRSRS